MFFSQYTNIDKLIGKLYINIIKDPFQVLSTSLMDWNVIPFYISFIAFYMAMIYCIIDRDDIFYLVILE